MGSVSIVFGRAMNWVAFTLACYAILLAGLWHHTTSSVKADALVEIDDKVIQAKDQVRNLESTIATNLRHLHGVAAIIAGDRGVIDLANNLEANPDQVSNKLAKFSQKVKVGVIWVLNSEGLCVSSSNAGSPESFVGTNYKDREYFLSAKAGRPGYQYAVGRKSNIPGLFFSSPILTPTGEFVGAVIVKIDLPAVSWVDQFDAWVTDHHGVVMLARDKSMELNVSPGGDVMSLPEDKRLAIYKRANFDTFYLKESSEWLRDGVYELGRPGSFSVLHSTELPDYKLLVTVQRHLDIASTYREVLRREFSVRAVILTLTMGMVIVTLAYLAAKGNAAAIMKDMAFHDALTQLPNRRLLQDRTEQAIRVAARNKHLCAIAFIDLDSFKCVNDTCGHEGGDNLLIAVSKRLRNCVRSADTVSRLGGDEFVVLLERIGTDITSATTNASAIAEKILASLNEPHTIRTESGDFGHFVCSGSIGIHVFDGGASTATVFRTADEAMYLAKKNGKNSISWK